MWNSTSLGIRPGISSGSHHCVTLDKLLNIPETQLSFSAFKMDTIIFTSETDWEEKSDKTWT